MTPDFCSIPLHSGHVKRYPRLLSRLIGIAVDFWHHVPLHSHRIGCCFKTTRTTVAIALACPQFVSIRFPGCSKVADAASLSAGALLRSISCIDLSSCILITDAGRVIVTRMLPIERHQSLTLQAFDG
jgi:hypothetical protein